MNQVPRAFQVNRAIVFHTTTRRGDAIDHPIIGQGKASEVFCLCDVSDQQSQPGSLDFRRCPGGSPQAEYFMPLPGQFRSKRQAHVTTPGDQNTHILIIPCQRTKAS